MKAEFCLWIRTSTSSSVGQHTAQFTFSISFSFILNLLSLFSSILSSLTVCNPANFMSLSESSSCFSASTKVWRRKRVSLANFKSCNCSEVPQLRPLLFSLQFVHHLTYHHYTTLCLQATSLSHSQDNCQFSLLHNLTCQTVTGWGHALNSTDGIDTPHFTCIYRDGSFLKIHKSATHTIFPYSTQQSCILPRLQVICLHDSLLDATVPPLDTLPQTTRKRNTPPLIWHMFTV